MHNANFGYALTFLAAMVLAQAGTGCRTTDVDDDVPTSPATKTLPYDRAIASLANDAGFSGSVLVALPDTVFEQSYRMAGAPERMATASSRRYPIGEIGQLLLRAAYFRLADQGRLNLNAPVAEFAPELNEVTYAGQPANINYRMLLDHRAGLPTQLLPGDRLSDIQLISQPGTEEHYSAVGYELLARALSARLGQPITEVIRVNVLEPASMTQTAAFEPKETDFPNRAVGFSDATGSLEEVDLQEFEEGGLVGGLPEYYSTVTDLFYLSQWMPESAYLRGTIRQPMVRPGYRGYFEAAVDGSKAVIVMSNYDGVQVAKLRELVSD